MKSRTQISPSQGKGLEITFLTFYAECFFMQQDFNQKRKHPDKQTCSLHCLQSAFSLKIRLVLISSSAIPNHDVIYYRDETRKDGLLTLQCSKQTLH